MCGIACVASFGNPLPHDSHTCVKAMCEALRHRGPDSEGMWNDNKVVLGHRRLAVIDTSAQGAQPMTSRTGRFVISYNGEVYNFREIASDLRRSGWSPVGGSDTEVLLAAIEAWGLQRTMERVDGMYAFVLYDRHLSTVSLVRDRFGEKPLVYATVNGLLLAASDITALLRSGIHSFTLSMPAVEDYFRFGHVPGIQTILSGVTRVRPGEIHEFELDTCISSSYSYWNPASLDFLPTQDPSENMERLSSLLSESVRTRMISDRPVGTFLSGGIDSSLITALATHHSSGPLRTYTMNWEEREFDEGDFGRQVANKLGTNHTDVTLSAAECPGLIEELAQLSDEPFADSSQLAVLQVSDRAARDVVVMLSGDGGDELFGGYNRHRWLPNLTSRTHGTVRRPIALASAKLLRSSARLMAAISSPLPLTVRPRFIEDKMRKAARVLSASDGYTAYQELIVNGTGIVGTPKNLDGWITGLLGSTDPDQVFLGCRLADMVSYLPDDILVKVDRATMRHSLECRAPFLQPQIAELAVQLDRNDLLAPGVAKKPLVALLRELLPGVDFTRPKMGFGVPIKPLLQGPLRSVLDESISSFMGRDLVTRIDFVSQVRSLENLPPSGVNDLWNLLMFERWLDKHPEFSRPL